MAWSDAGSGEDEGGGGRAPALGRSRLPSLAVPSSDDLKHGASLDPLGCQQLLLPHQGEENVLQALVCMFHVCRRRAGHVKQGNSLVRTGGGGCGVARPVGLGRAEVPQLRGRVCPSQCLPAPG